MYVPSLLNVYCGVNSKDEYNIRGFKDPDTYLKSITISIFSKKINIHD